MIALVSDFPNSEPDSISSQQVEDLLDIASSGTKVSIQAQNLLQYYGYATYDHEILKINQGERSVENAFADEVLENSNTFTIVPNPSNGIIDIRVELDTEYTRSKIVIRNLIGNAVLEQNIVQNSTHINIEELTAGVYICLFISDNTISGSERLIKVD